MQDLETALKWRYATKKMNGEPVPPADLEKIIHAIRMAPSSSGLQPYRLIVVTNRQVLEQIKPVANNQSQITDCSALIVFAAYDGYSDERITNYFTVQNTLRNTPDHMTDDYRKGLIKVMTAKTPQQQFEHAARQAYIGLGFGLVQAAMLRVDTSPMEGFDNQALDELLNLNAAGLKSVALMAVGYRADSGDWLVNLPKARFPHEEFVRYIK